MKESPGNAVNGHCSCSAAKFWAPKYSCRNRGDVQVCSGCKRHLGSNTSRCHLQPKACPCHASQGAGSTSGLCPALGKDSLLCTTGLEEALWVENSIFKHCHSVLCVCCNPSQIPAPCTGTRGRAGFPENSCGKAGEEQEENTG